MKKQILALLFILLATGTSYGAKIETADPVLTGDWDFGSATLEVPNSTSLPATCVVGQVYMDTNATTGQRIYACESTNTWALQGDGGGAGSSNSFETVDVPAGTDPVADSATDTLNITETSFLVITGTAGTDTIHITQVTTDLGADGLIAADAVALGTDTTGNYAGSSSEGGAATTATALAANGSNCSAGSAPLGVDASGAVESCTDYEEEVTEGSLADSTIVSADIKDGEIVNADLSASAAIAYSKLAALTSANILVGSAGNVATSVAMSGDVFIDNTGATAVQANAVALGTDTTGNYAGSSSEGGAATTATALAANGSNCSSGNYPLGVDASGAVESCTADVDTNAVAEMCFTAGATLPLDAADSIPPLTSTAGTNVDIITASFDDSTDECRQVHIKVPSDVQSGSTVTFRNVWNSLTATTGDVIWDTRYQSTGAEGESWDASLTTKAATADTAQGTVKLRTVTTVTETLANLGWAANDDVYIQVCRDANAAGDTLVGDAQLEMYCVEIPRA